MPRRKTTTITNRMSLVKMQDNLNSDSRTNINHYIRALDKRLSVPKFRNGEESGSPRRQTGSKKKLDKTFLIDSNINGNGRYMTVT